VNRFETQPVPGVWSRHLYIRIPRQEIVFFKFILEGYDNLATMTVVDKYEAILQLAFHPGQEQEVFELITGLSSEMEVELLPFSFVPGNAEGLD
jgi:hypothetical protein